MEESEVSRTVLAKVLAPNPFYLFSSSPDSPYLVIEWVAGSSPQKCAKAGAMLGANFGVTHQGAALHLQKTEGEEAMPCKILPGQQNGVFFFSSWVCKVSPAQSKTRNRKQSPTTRPPFLPNPAAKVPPHIPAPTPKSEPGNKLSSGCSKTTLAAKLTTSKPKVAEKREG